jgi:hypothetical protein
MPSLTRLLATADPSRGGRGGLTRAGTTETIRKLLADQGRRKSTEIQDQAARASDLEQQLADQRKFIAENMVHHDQLAALLAIFSQEIREAWPRLSVCLELGGDEFDRIWDRIEGRTFYGWSEDQADEHIRATYDDE